MTTRIPTSPTDFGDPLTVGLNLIRKGKDFKTAGENDFGVFLGFRPPIGWAIGIKEIMSWRLKEIERFESLEALKAQWELD